MKSLEEKPDRDSQENIPLAHCCFFVQWGSSLCSFIVSYFILIKKEFFLPLILSGAQALNILTLPISQFQ